MIRSDLETLCFDLLTTGRSVGAVTTELSGRGHSLRRTAEQLASARAGADSAWSVVRSAVQLLAEAATACERASAHLSIAQAEANAYVLRTVGGGSVERGDWTPDQQDLIDYAAATPAGTAYLSPADIDPNVDLVRHFPGEFMIAVHGDETTVGSRDGTTTADARAMADVIRNTGWTGRPVRLLSCDTGLLADGFAQQLADELGVTVMAPDCPVGIDEAGRPVLDPGGTHPDGEPGSWHVFHPHRL